MEKEISGKSGKEKGSEESEKATSNKILIEDMDLSLGSKILLEMSYGGFRMAEYYKNSEIEDMDVSPERKALLNMS